MLTAARCEKCNHALPLKGELGDFRLPPAWVPCPGCGYQCPTILPYRVGWTEALLWKVYALASVPVSALVALSGEHSALVTLAIVVLGPLVGGILGGFLLSRLTAFPLTLLRDASRRRRS
jgi:hypothetical protein